MTIINDKAGGRTRERFFQVLVGSIKFHSRLSSLYLLWLYTCFFQLSEDLSTLRWSWTDCLLVLEITEIRYDACVT